MKYLTTYYNPLGYNSRRVNFWKFINALPRSILTNLTVIEGVQSNSWWGSELFPALENSYISHIIEYSDKIEWQKEKLLNIGIKSCNSEYVTCLDCDLCVSDVNEFSKNIEEYIEARRHNVNFIQPFKYIIFMNKSENIDDYNNIEILPNSFEEGCKLPSFCYSYLNNSYIKCHYGSIFTIKTNIVKDIGLFEGGIFGTGDDLMCAAITDRWSTLVSYYGEAYKKWAQEFHRRVNGQIGYVPHTIYHMYHGKHSNRGYYNVELIKKMSPNKEYSAEELKTFLVNRQEDE